jgi:hypothetical protein
MSKSLDKYFREHLVLGQNQGKQAVIDYMETEKNGQDSGCRKARGRFRGIRI